MVQLQARRVCYILYKIFQYWHCLVVAPHGFVCVWFAYRLQDFTARDTVKNLCGAGAADLVTFSYSLSMIPQQVSLFLFRPRLVYFRCSSICCFVYFPLFFILVLCIACLGVMSFLPSLPFVPPPLPSVQKRLLAIIGDDLRCKTTPFLLFERSKQTLQYSHEL